MPSTESELVEELRVQDASQRLASVDAWLRRRAGEVVPLLAAAGTADPALHDLGFDSMSAMELRHRIETELSISLPAAEFSGNLTIGKLGTLVLERLVAGSVVGAASGQDDDYEEIRL